MTPWDDMLLFMSSGAHRPWLLVTVATLTFLATVVCMWGRRTSPVIAAIGTMCAGMCVQYTYYSAWVLCGRIAWTHHYLFPNIGSALKIAGLSWFLGWLLTKGRTNG